MIADCGGERGECDGGCCGGIWGALRVDLRLDLRVLMWDEWDERDERVGFGTAIGQWWAEGVVVSTCVLFKGECQWLGEVEARRTRQRNARPNAERYVGVILLSDQRFATEKLNLMRI